MTINVSKDLSEPKFEIKSSRDAFCDFNEDDVKAIQLIKNTEANTK